MLKNWIANFLKVEGNCWELVASSMVVIDLLALCLTEVSRESMVATADEHFFLSGLVGLYCMSDIFLIFRKKTGVFHRKKAVSKKQDDEQIKSEPSHDTYKGFWVQDLRYGYGVCTYDDSSRYIGEWKVNKRHGYGLFIDKDKRKSGGKWYNENLLLMTRRKNLRLPMIKKKMNRIVLAAFDAGERATSKAKLATTRGLSAKKIAVVAQDVANLAEINAQKAVYFRQKYTLHPCVEG